MSWFGIGAAAVSVVGTAYSSYSQKKAAQKAAQIDNSTAGYNARYDVAQAQQLDYDTLQNIRTQREAGKVFLSRNEAAYAAAGVLTTTGSPLHAQITNVGRLEQQIQQKYLDSQQAQAALYAKAKAGILAGEATASADKSAGDLALVNGGVSIARQLYGGYQSGLFSGGGSKVVPVTDPKFGG